MKVAVLKKTPKKRIIWPWVLIILDILFVITPLAICYLVLLDPNTKKVDLEPGFSLKTFGERVLVDSLDDTVKDESLHMAITENDIDNLLDVSLNNTGLKNHVVKKSYIKMNDNQYNFYIDLDATVIKTRLRIKTELNESEDKKAFNFKIKDVGIGNLSGLAKYSKGFVDRYINPTMVDNFFAQAGLSMKLDKDNYQIVYNKADVVKDLDRMNGTGTMGLYYNIIETLLDREEAKYEVKKGYFLNIDFNLKKMQTNELCTDTDKQVKVKSKDVSEKCRDNLIKLVNNGVIKPGTDEMVSMFTYLFCGYEGLTTKDQEMVKSKNLSSIGLADQAAIIAYNGLYDFNRDPNYMFNKMKNNLMKFDALESGSTDIVLLSEDDLNTYIAGRNVLGFTTLLNRYDKEKFKLNYITVDNFYSNIYQNASSEQLAEFVCKVNLNGYTTSLTFVTDAKTNETLDAMTFTVRKEEGIRYGQITAPELDETFFKIVSQTLNGGDSTISADETNHSITLTFNGILEEARTAMKADATTKYESYGPAVVSYVHDQIDHLLRTENIKINIVGDSREDEGGLNLTLLDNDYVPPVLP